ncbi:hypothetical protein VTN31DRAFT_4443 [Thermomyces dupontii]|uniref:uncharacterized protein n=1 Tax=Talaromyces thermophilus TaxID=28565 RepID=UPI0037434F5D
MAWFRLDAPPDQRIPQEDHAMVARYGSPTRNEDSVILREEFPGHVMWTDPVFNGPEYKQFAAQVKRCLQEERPPLEVQLRQVVPALAEQLGLLTRMVWQVTQYQATLMQQYVADLQEREAGIQMQIAALQRQPGGSSGNALPSATEQRPRSEPASSWPATVAAELGPNPAPDDPRHPIYTMSREVKTVPDLWRVWTEGLHGNPPIQVLESQHGSEWRREHNERMFCHCRKRIIDAIQERCRRGMPIRAVVEELEQMPARGNMSLHKLSEAFRKWERS